MNYHGFFTGIRELDLFIMGNVPLVERASFVHFCSLMDAFADTLGESRIIPEELWHMFKTGKLPAGD